MRRCLANGSLLFLLVVLLLDLLAGQVVAGMPAFLPEDIKTVLQLLENPHRRLQAISFFLLGLGISTVFVKLLWNVLAEEFTRMPRLTFPKAFAVVLVWGLLFLVVLAMIGGARELMTPGAWKKDGSTYTLADEQEPEAEKTNPEKILTPVERRPEKGSPQ